MEKVKKLNDEAKVKAVDDLLNWFDETPKRLKDFLFKVQGSFLWEAHPGYDREEAGLNIHCLYSFLSSLERVEGEHE